MLRLDTLVKEPLKRKEGRQRLRGRGSLPHDALAARGHERVAGKPSRCGKAGGRLWLADPEAAPTYPHLLELLPGCHSL